MGLKDCFFVDGVKKIIVNVHIYFCRGVMNEIFYVGVSRMIVGKQNQMDKLV